MDISFEVQAIMILVAGGASTLIIESIKNFLSKRGVQHEIPDIYMHSIVLLVCVVGAGTLELVRCAFDWSVFFANLSGTLGVAYLLYQFVLKQIKIKGQPIKDMLENN